jgi:NADPH-dependent 2,4-dienoyl-CoA reductase/sulfur reductase-like enzyme
MTPRIVVVGADAAGASAASTIKRRQPAWDVVVLERSQDTSYAACGLPYWVAGQVANRSDLIARTPAQHRANGLDLRLGVEVTGVDLAAGHVIGHRDGTEESHPYDTLVIATGATPVRPPIPGINAPNVGAIHTLGGTAQMIAQLDGIRPSGAGATIQAVVIGAGYVGIEMAEAFLDRGCSVTVIDIAETPMTSLDPDMGEVLAERMRAQGINLALGAAVRQIELNAEGLAIAVTTDEHRFPAQIVVAALGIRPNTGFATSAGLVAGTSGGLLTDRRQRTLDHPEVFAAGDCTESYHRLLRRTMNIPLGTHANKQGLVAGENAAGGYRTFPGVIGTAITKVGDTHIARTGLTEAQAAEAGFEAVSATVRTPVIAGYMPDPGTMTTKLLAERGTGRLVGGQIIGDRVNAAKRIDTAAVAIWTGLTAEEVTGLDLAYAPPSSGVWDPIQVAARRLVAVLDRR